MIAECRSPSTSMVYYLIPGGNLEQEGGVESLQVVGLDGVVGESGFGDVVDEGDEGDELNEGDEGDVFEGDELNELVCYDWMNDGLEGADFADDIFGGNEDDNAVLGEVVGIEGNNSTHEPEVGSNGGNNGQPGVRSNEGNNAQPEFGNNAQPEVRNNAQLEVGNNAQLARGIDRIRVRQYAPFTTRPNQPDVQATNWTEPGIEDYEIYTGAISDDEDPRDRHPKFNQEIDMRKPELVIAMIRKTNVGSKVFIKCDCSEDGGQPKFLRIFGGQLLAATARDGNDNIFLVALAVVEQEFNNISESFNVMSLPARDKPILSMLEWIRVRLMTRLHTKRIGMEKYGGSMCPNVQDKLLKLKMESRSFFAMPSGRFKYEVDNDYERHVVDLTKKECTCRIWDLTGIPCKHGVAAIYKNCEHPEDYLHECYLKEAYLDVYSEIIHPMPGQDEWIKIRHLPLQPPHVLRLLGRPKKLRRRDPDEPRNPRKVSRMNRHIKCGKCNKVGHNSRSCNAGITAPIITTHIIISPTITTLIITALIIIAPSSQPQPSQPATRSRSAQWFSSTQPTTHAPRETWHSRASSSQPVSVRDSIARGAGRGRGATSGVGSGAGRGIGATSGVGNGASRDVGRGSTSGAGIGSTSGQASGVGKGSISGQASGASRGSTSGSAV
uniref:SWIM-type domain-containing protein n=1 Tax=Fagus sylvatica TaxID=28930 RepID=A0A2N9H3T4_FAGSY